MACLRILAKFALESGDFRASAEPAGLQTVENLSLLFIADQRRSENQEVLGTANGFSDFRHRHGHSSRHSSGITRPGPAGWISSQRLPAIACSCEAQGSDESLSP